MKTISARSRRPVRSARLESTVEPRIFEAVEQFAIANGYTLSSALYRILIDWEKKERIKVARKNRVC